MKALLVACAIIVEDNKVLITQRGPHKSEPYKWEFPGGKVEKSETPEDCICREILEELNLNISVTGKLTVAEFRAGTTAITLIPFLAKRMSGSIVLREHISYKWCTIKELSAYSWSPADLPVIAELKKLSE